MLAHSSNVELGLIDILKNGLLPDCGEVVKRASKLIRNQHKFALFIDVHLLQGLRRKLLQG